MCTRVDTSINKHFSFKILLFNPQPPLINSWIRASLLMCTQIRQTNCIDKDYKRWGSGQGIGPPGKNFLTCRLDPVSCIWWGDRGSHFTLGRIQEFWLGVWNFFQGHGRAQLAKPPEAPEFYWIQPCNYSPHRWSSTSFKRRYVPLSTLHKWGIFVFPINLSFYQWGVIWVLLFVFLGFLGFEPSLHTALLIACFTLYQQTFTKIQ